MTRSIKWPIFARIVVLSPEPAAQSGNERPGVVMRSQVSEHKTSPPEPPCMAGYFGDLLT
jgi:hypothetical protein